MSGQELIDQIVKELLRDKTPPMDSAIVNKLRQRFDALREARNGERQCMDYRVSDQE